jgi:hypothetical protein
VIADQGADEKTRKLTAHDLLEARERGRTGLVTLVERGAVLEEEHRSAPARNAVGCGCGHAFFLSTERAAPLHP